MGRLKNWWRGATHDHDHDLPDMTDHVALYTVEAAEKQGQHRRDDESMQQWSERLDRTPAWPTPNDPPRDDTPAPSQRKQHGHADKGNLEDLTDQTKQGRDQLETIFDTDEQAPALGIEPGITRGPRYRR